MNYLQILKPYFPSLPERKTKGPIFSIKWDELFKNGPSKIVEDKLLKIWSDMVFWNNFSQNNIKCQIIVIEILEQFLNFLCLTNFHVYNNFEQISSFDAISFLMMFKIVFCDSYYPAGIYLIKVKNGNFSTMCEICPMVSFWCLNC